MTFFISVALGPFRGAAWRFVRDRRDNRYVNFTRARHPFRNFHFAVYFHVCGKTVRAVSVRQREFQGFLMQLFTFLNVFFVTFFDYQLSSSNYNGYSNVVFPETYVRIYRSKQYNDQSWAEKDVPIFNLIGLATHFNRYLFFVTCMFEKKIW